MKDELVSDEELNHISILNSVTLKAYAVLGNKITTCVNEQKLVGNYEVEFSTIGGSASDGDVYSLPCGIYFYTLNAGEFAQTRKMILLK